MIYYKDNKYCFAELFNDDTGMLIRSNTIVNGVESSFLPEARSFPELIDIGIMGACVAGKTGLCRNAGIDCYQRGMNLTKGNMSLSDYKKILDQCKGRVFQIALGGAGDPNKHESFEEILQTTRTHRIVPNYTTSGYELSDEEVRLTKQYCGAVAVSFYSRLNPKNEENNPSTINAIERFIDAGCITNIHYILSRKSIKEAVYRVKNGLFPEGINSVVFLLYKPVGLGSKENVLNYDDQDYYELLHLISNGQNRWRYGFDTCQSPALYSSKTDFAKESIEFCEAARFSMYINSELIAFPCSFGIDDTRFSIDLNTHTLQEAWESEEFKQFRIIQQQKRAACSQSACKCCALNIEFDICGKNRKTT